MKRAISLICLLSLLLAMTACKKKAAPAPTTAPPTTAPEAAIPEPGPDVPPAKILLPALEKLYKEKSFVVAMDSTMQYGDATSTTTEQLQTVCKLQQDDHGYTALITTNEGVCVYMCGAEIYRTQAPVHESKNYGHNLEIVLEEFYRLAAFHGYTVEEFSAALPQYTKNPDGSITFTLPELTFAEYSWLVMGIEMTNEEAALYVSKGISMSFTVDAAGYLSRAEVNAAWATADGTQQSGMHAVFTVSQIGQELDIQAPDWVYG